MVSAAETLHGGTFTLMIRRKGVSDEYVIQSLLNWINSLGGAKFELKCDQEPALVEIRDILIKLAKVEREDPNDPKNRITEGATLIPYATLKGSKGSLGHAERAHLSAGGMIRVLRLAIERDYGITVKPDDWFIPWLVRHASWTNDKCQPKWSGMTSYQSRRGRAYHTPSFRFFRQSYTRS